MSISVFCKVRTQIHFCKQETFDKKLENFDKTDSLKKKHSSFSKPDFMDRGVQERKNLFFLKSIDSEDPSGSFSVKDQGLINHETIFPHRGTILKEDCFLRLDLEIYKRKTLNVNKSAWRALSRKGKAVFLKTFFEIILRLKKSQIK